MAISTSDGLIYEDRLDMLFDRPSYDAVKAEWQKRHPDMKLSDTVSRKYLAMANEYDRKYDNVSN